MALDNMIQHKKYLVQKNQDLLLSYKNKVTKSDRSLLNALGNNHSAFICEIKLGSPSLGIINKDIDVVSVAKVYEPFASAISVLADEKFFLGSMANVQKVRETVNCPVLCKDIIVDPLQVYEARYHKADAILLMLSVLSDQEYLVCQKIAQKLDLDIITEVHTKEEMLRANNLQASIIGINNRDLKTLKIDLTTTINLSKLAHKNSVVISESGYKNHQQIKIYKHLVDGFLIGTSLMSAKRIDLALREMIFGKIKICGLKTPQDAIISYEAGAYYGGLNFIKQSRRYISKEQALNIIDSAPLMYGGVFADHTQTEICELVKSLNLSFVQLHGNESQSYIAQLREKLPKSCEIWQCIKVKDHINWPKNLIADCIVLDTFNENMLGGSGLAFNWSLLNKLENSHKFVLAGGIKENNIKEAQSTNAIVLDIASGAEDDLGNKDSYKLKNIFNTLKEKK